MGPCLYCKQMIYHEWIAERGYHRDCHEKYLAGRKFAAFEAEATRNRVIRAEREHEKRRERKRLKRIAAKAKPARSVDRTSFQLNYWDVLQPGAKIKALDEIAIIIQACKGTGFIKARTMAGKVCGCYIEQVQEIHTGTEVLVQELVK